MRIIGIDPAPKKDTTIFDPRQNDENPWHKISPTSLRKYLLDLKATNEDILLVWDAPLTTGSNTSDFYTRPIEKFFHSGEEFKISDKKKYPSARGISVLGYAGCPHWTISQAVLGLPLQAQSQNYLTPFQLVASGTFPNPGRSYVVECHPALAIWLWLGLNSPKFDLRYKGKSTKVIEKETVRLSIWNNLTTRFRLPIADHFPQFDQTHSPQNDDELDAFVAWLIGILWQENKEDDKVILLGNEDTGSMLLPGVNKIAYAFDKFPKDGTEADQA